MRLLVGGAQKTVQGSSESFALRMLRSKSGLTDVQGPFELGAGRSEVAQLMENVADPARSSSIASHRAHFRSAAA